jgi:hypothetical protein
MDPTLRLPPPHPDAYIAFLRSGVHDDYWRVLAAAGLTRERLESWEQPLTREPRSLGGSRNAFEEERGGSRARRGRARSGGARRRGCKGSRHLEALLVHHPFQAGLPGTPHPPGLPSVVTSPPSTPPHPLSPSTPPDLPLHLPQLLAPMQHYRWVLMTCHAGAELDVALEMAKGHLSDDLRRVGFGYGAGVFVVFFWCLCGDSWGLRAHPCACGWVRACVWCVRLVCVRRHTHMCAPGWVLTHGPVGWRTCSNPPQSTPWVGVCICVGGGCGCVRARAKSVHPSGANPLVIG